MGACGCGDFAGIWKLKGPGEIIYTIGYYPSCSDCKIPAGMELSKFKTLADAQMFCADELPDYPFSEDGTSLICIVDPEKLKKAMTSWAEEIRKELQAGGDDYDPEGLISDAIDETFRDAVFETIKEDAKLKGLEGTE
ncbi:MAG: hypothetical protein ABIL58_27740 [Pseudomonadota bacterium]